MSKNKVMMKRNQDGKWSIDDVQYMSDGGIGGLFQDFASSMTAQNPYQATLAPTQNQNYSPLIDQAGQNALGGQGYFNQNQAQQQQLAQALQATAMGQGFNPATAMLHNATGANTANQAALMAGQRGAGANPALIARQAAMQGAANQQNALGQAAALQAQQSIGAQQQQSALLGQMGQQNIAQQGVQSGLFSAGAGAQNAQNSTNVQNYGMAQGLNQSTAEANAKAVNTTTGGLINGIGSMGSSFLMPKKAYKGGMIPDHLQHVHASYYADGGQVPPPEAYASQPVQGQLPDQMKDTQAASKVHLPMNVPSGQAQEWAQKNRPVSGYIWPGDEDRQKAISKQRQENEALEKGSRTIAPDYKNGGPVPGEAKVKGDSPKNDTQPAMLSPGEIVIPRSITSSPDAPEKAKEFVEALLKKQGHGNSKHHKEFKDALKQAILSRKK